MDSTMNIILLTIAGVCLVLYLMRRRAGCAPRIKVSPVRLARRSAALVLGGLLLGGCAWSGHVADGTTHSPGSACSRSGQARAGGRLRPAPAALRRRCAHQHVRRAPSKAPTTGLRLPCFWRPAHPRPKTICESPTSTPPGVQDAAYEAADPGRPRRTARWRRLTRPLPVRGRDWGWPERGLGAAYTAVYFGGESASVQNTLATMLDALGELDGARDAYQRALTINPTAAWALNNLCYLEFRAGRLEEARSLCEASLRQSPGFAAAQQPRVGARRVGRCRPRANRAARPETRRPGTTTGMLALARGDYAAAAEAFEEAI